MKVKEKVMEIVFLVAAYSGSFTDLCFPLLKWYSGHWQDWTAEFPWRNCLETKQ